MHGIEYVSCTCGSTRTTGPFAGQHRRCAHRDRRWRVHRATGNQHTCEPSRIRGVFSVLGYAQNKAQQRNGDGRAVWNTQSQSGLSTIHVLMTSCHNAQSPPSSSCSVHRKIAQTKRHISSRSSGVCRRNTHICLEHCYYYYHSSPSTADDSSTKFFVHRHRHGVRVVLCVILVL